jgi:hypothetical protein
MRPRWGVASTITAFLLLVAGQVKSRSHLGARPTTNPIPINYFGSAWATLGLTRSIPPKARP